MSHWNFRVIQHKDGTLGVHEVYYSDDGKIEGWTGFPVTESFAGDSIESIRKHLQRYERALNEPILKLEELEKR